VSTNATTHERDPTSQLKISKEFINHFFEFTTSKMIFRDFEALVRVIDVPALVRMLLDDFAALAPF
jgi:hypothetical protein